ncbi:UDP-N-acetylglucosamine 2-epimerase [bacterium]|nr:UDP-N-acetylglucosamine 2-epimerase [bacterium]
MRPILLFVIGTRSEALASGPVIQRLRALPDAPFQVRVATTGQEDTELAQALMVTGVVPDTRVEVKQPHLADANLNAALLDQAERLLRHQLPAAVVAVGSSATAWAAGLAAWFKGFPLIHLRAGVFAKPGSRPMPDWMHRAALTPLPALHLCPDETALEALRKRLGDQPVSLGVFDPEGKPRGEADAWACVVGDPADEVLAASLASESEPPDPVLSMPLPNGSVPSESDLRRVIAFLSRREHHANGLRPLCEALDALSQRHPARHFVAVHSLQSHICDALVALLPRRTNLRDVSPLPHPAFIREVARSPLVITDSVGLAREAILLRRPLILVGAYSETESLAVLAEEARVSYRVIEMDQAAIESAVEEILGEEPAEPVQVFAASPASERAAQAILAWWGIVNPLG